MVEYRIDLEAYGGPMDLLLYLVRKNEIDVYDIPIADVLDQYLDHLKLLRDLDVDGVGEFLVMASTLMEIKSRMLLPHPEEEEEEEEEDPRADLVRQLLEYKRFKDVSEELGDRRREQGMRYPRGSSGAVATDGEDDDEPVFSLGEIGLWDLCAAYSRLLQEIEINTAREVVYDETPLEEHMDAILDGLHRREEVSFRGLFPARADRGVLVGLFVALLELIRLRKICVFQGEDFGEIRVRLRDGEDAPREDARRKAPPATRDPASPPAGPASDPASPPAGDPSRPDAPERPTFLEGDGPAT